MTLSVKAAVRDVPRRPASPPSSCSVPSSAWFWGQPTTSTTDVGETGHSGEAAAHPPEAIPGQGQGESDVNRGLGPLEGPVAAGGLVGDGDPDAVAGQAVQ